MNISNPKYMPGDTVTIHPKARASFMFEGMTGKVSLVYFTVAPKSVRGYSYYVTQIGGPWYAHEFTEEEIGVCNGPDKYTDGNIGSTG